MNNIEAVTLCRYVKAVCPQQAIDQFTPDAWADLLVDIRFDDAREATRNITKRSPFVSPAEIITEVKRIRQARIAVHTDPIPPAGLNADETVAWLRQAWKRIGDGDMLPDDQRGEVSPRPVRELVSQIRPTLSNANRNGSA